MAQKIVEALVDGGKATPAPPLGPTLSQFKVNVGKVVQDINEKTKEYGGMKVPVKIVIDDVTKEYKIEVGTPPVSSLIKKELGLEILGVKEEKPAEGVTEEVKKEEPKTPEKLKPWERGTPKEEVEGVEEVKEVEATGKEETPAKKERVIVGNLTMDQCIKIMKMKMDSLLAKDTKKALKEIVASVVSMPLTIEGKNPKEILKEIDEGKYDDKLK